ncbi:MAG: hypothetical protein WBP29_04130 [Candidatus Zixiibacteriota bacterium]
MRLLLFLVVIALTPVLLLSQDLSSFDSAMSQIGMSHENIQFDQNEMATWGGDMWRLTYFTLLHESPFKLPRHALINLESYTTDCGNLSALIANAGRKIDCPVRRGLVGDALAEYSQRLDSMPAETFTARNKFLPYNGYKELRRKVDLIFALIEDENFNFNHAFAKPYDLETSKHVFEYFIRENKDYNDSVEAIVAETDFNRLIGGAEDIAEVLRMAADSLANCAFPESRVEFKSSKGLIIIGSDENDEYSYKIPPLLILDPGGDDTYEVSQFTSAYPLSAIIDADGNDRYVSSDSTSPGIGGALLGMSVVIDMAGNDIYDAIHVAQGSGIFGVGAVMDNNGNDRYRSKGFSQGCGVFGVGILSDSVGSDSLYCWSNSQGYGYTRGCGLCINFAGDDVYVAEDSILFSPGQQTQEHYSSLAQGVGFGKRADYLDGHSWAGGVGILCDISGDDEYSAGLFAQGCGYWFALGMLLDGSGNDNYFSVWYTLGSGAHFAIGYLDDFAGNDKYSATMNMSIGSGHDFTIGYFNERAGNDIYEAPGLSLGGGNFQGIGIFHDWRGDDTYNSSGGLNLGGARGLLQGPRGYLLTFGVFVDDQGIDKYIDQRVGNSLRWTSPKSDSLKPSSYEIGVGIDR